MSLSDQQLSSTYRRTWRFPLPKWLRKGDLSFNQGVYVTFSLGLKARD